MINSESTLVQLRQTQEDFSFNDSQYNENGEELFRAGQFVPAGTYLETESFRMVTLEIPGRLPASLDGRRSYYRRFERPWLNM